MQFSSNRKRDSGRLSGALHNNKRAKISIYDVPPTMEISMEEFEQFALDRMRVLKAIDAAKAKGLKPDEVREIIKQQCALYLPLDGKDEYKFMEERRKDEISHFILRIAYSKTEDLRRWFLRQEEILFRHRFTELDVQARNHAIEMLTGTEGGKLLNITEHEWVMHSAGLQKVFGSAVVDDKGNTLQDSSDPWNHVYKVPFEQVLDLVSGRRLLLVDGEAFVVSRDIVSVVISNFRLRLSRHLTENARAFYAKAEEEAERLGPLLENLTNAYLGPSFSSGPVVGRITLDKVPTAMARSAPLCMKALYDTLTDKHHLKHDARMQFGLFLKGIGVTLEDSIALWKEEMMRGGKTSEQFDKQYAYSIRHNYGMEGKRTDYSPYGCGKIINQTPVGDQVHGCPYRHWSAQHLQSALASMRLGPNVVSDVMEKVKGQHYQVACLRVFEATHKGGTVDALNHPNQYFQDSIKYWDAKNGDQAGGAAPAAEAAQTPAKPTEPAAAPIETSA